MTFLPSVPGAVRVAAPPTTNSRTPVCASPSISDRVVGITSFSWPDAGRIVEITTSCPALTLATSSTLPTSPAMTLAALGKELLFGQTSQPNVDGHAGCTKLANVSSGSIIVG